MAQAINQRNRADDLPAAPRARPGHMMGRIEKPRDSRQALQRLIPYLSPFRLTLVLVFFCVIAYTLLGLAGPYLMGIAIDQYIVPKRVDGLGRIALWMLATYLLNNLFQAASGWLMASISQKALKQLRQDLFSHLQTLSIGFFDRNPAGQLMSRLTNDIDAVNQAVSQNVVSLLAGVLSLVAILIAMFALDAWLALASVLVVPILFWFTQFIAKYTRRGFRDLQKQMGDLNAVMEEAISGQKVIKAFRRNDSVVESFRTHNQEVYSAGVYANSYALLIMPLMSVLGNFFVIVLASLGGWLALRGLVSVGVITTFIIYGQNFINPLRMLANMYNSIQAALAGAERVFEVIDTDSEVDEGSPTLALPQEGGNRHGTQNGSSPLERRVGGGDLQGHVRFEQVDFSYDGSTPILKGMTLEAKPGETIALVGPTGAGKTTIINLLTRFYEISSGTISIDGVDIRQFSKADLRRQLGLVLQDTFLFADTVLENIRFGRLDATDQECMHAAKLADADHFIHQLPKGYQTELSERASNLSQGQRQLLAIARAILANPRILILDEATSSVDTRTEARIQESLLRLMEGRTSFVIAHRLSTIRDADQVLVIHNGEIVEKGTHDQLLAQRGFYHQLYMSQFKGQAI